MNINDIRKDLNDILLMMDENLSEEQKIIYINLEVPKYLSALIDNETIHDYTIICDSSNQRSDENIIADVAVHFLPNTRSFSYIQLHKKR